MERPNIKEGLMNKIKRVFIFLALLFTLSIPCSNPFKMVYTNGYELAVQQESLLVKYKRGDTISSDTLRDLKINYWVHTAYKVAPGNLVIRQYALIDLFTGKPDHAKKIKHLVNVLSSGTTVYNYRTWAEGYSYWIYTKDILVPWIEKFDTEKNGIGFMADDIDNGFAYTSYLKYNEGKYYPAPFGDLWNIPLDSTGQYKANMIAKLADTAKIINVTRLNTGYTICYRISALPIGMNGHCEKESKTYRIENYSPLGFKYYEGYKLKYSDQTSEWKDLLNPIRLITIPFIW